MSRWMRIALKRAQKSRHHRYKVGAVVVRGGTILSQGHNTARDILVHPNDVVCLRGNHAEFQALRANGDYRGANIYVARWKIGMSRPCSECMEIIKEAGIKKIFYLDAKGNVKNERVG